jgi:TctA family transporter
MEKSYSEKVARVLEIGCYVMMLPAVFGFLLSLILAIFGFVILSERGNPFPLLGYLIFWLIPVFGFWLFSRYAKHSRSNLPESRITGMWISTVIFNGLLALPNLIWFFNFIFSDDKPNYQSSNMESATFMSAYFLIFIWQVATVVLSISALISHRKQKNVR